MSGLSESGIDIHGKLGRCQLSIVSQKKRPVSNLPGDEFQLLKSIKYTNLQSQNGQASILLGCTPQLVQVFC